MVNWTDDNLAIGYLRERIYTNREQIEKTRNEIHIFQKNIQRLEGDIRNREKDTELADTEIWQIIYHG
jgi:peptidoglycan hydrolase CwlO-like protein